MPRDVPAAKGVGKARTPSPYATPYATPHTRPELGPASNAAAPEPDKLAAKPSPHPHLDDVLAQTRTRKIATGYDPQFCADVVAVMGEGFSLTAFAGAIDASRPTLDAWIAAEPAFAAAVERGRAARTRALETQFLTAGTGAKVAAHVFALKNAAPEDWREHPDAETNKPQSTVVEMPPNGRAGVS